MHDNYSGFDLHPAFVWPLLTLLSGNSDPRYSWPDEPNQTLNNDLLREIHALSIAGYEALIAQLLQAVGYERVRVLRDPTSNRRSHKGRNSHGGVDIIASTRCGLANDAVMVQVKQYERPVSRRFVDELRGALLRTEARHGLLITTSYFSPAAVQAAREDHIAPIHLMDGEKLRRLLMQHRIGIGSGWHGCPRIDGSFFKNLSAKYPPVEPAMRQVKPREKTKARLKEAQEVNVSPAAVNFSINEGGAMMGRTHALIGIVSLWLLELPGAITQEAIAPLVLFAVIGALSPDLDASESKLKRFSIAGIMPMVPLAIFLHQSLGHRGLLHSLAGLGIFIVLCALPIALWLGWLFGAALALGYASHLAADSATKSGVPLLYPRRQRYHLLPKGWRLTTGSLAEEALLPFLAFAILLLLMRHLYLIP